MRNPIRSETDAFRLTIAAALLVILSIVIGWLVEPLIGVLVFVLVGAVALVVYLRSPDQERNLPLRRAMREPHRHGARPGHGRRHVLVVANETLAGEELRERIRAAANGSLVEVDVLAPVLTSRTHLAVTDIDEELREARSRLERSLAWARAQGFIARGEVGDPSPTTAIEDELRDFGADEVIVVTSSRDLTGWQERVELERLREELDVPIAHVVMEAEAGSADAGQ